MKTEAPRYFYIIGCKTRQRAQELLIDSFADGDVSQAELPIVESYIAKNGERRWGVTLSNGL